MTASGPKSLPTLGFLTVREYEELGLIGAYLVLNFAGRPLEFHCTTPVRPNRAQEILYGPTLKPFLYGEQIAQTLVARAKQPALFVCTDRAPVMALRNLIQPPVLLLEEPPPPPRQDADPQLRVDLPHATQLPHFIALKTFEFGGHVVAVRADAEHDQKTIESHWERQRGELDLREPFARLGEAIEETQRGAARGT